MVLKQQLNDAQTTVLLMCFRSTVIYFIFCTNKQHPASLACSFIVNLIKLVEAVDDFNWIPAAVL